MKFLCDRTLGKLAKWLRILGYDTCWEESDQRFRKRAGQEGRIALTRRKRLACLRDPERLVVVRADQIHEQIGELLDTLSLKPDPKDRMSRCLRCNTPLQPAERVEVEETVPAHVFQNGHDFSKCPDCGRIYWPGSHPLRVEDYLKRHIPTHHP